MGEQWPTKWLDFEHALISLVAKDIDYAFIDQVRMQWSFFAAVGIEKLFIVLLLLLLIRYSWLYI